MAKEFFEYDALNGVTYYTEQINETTILHTEQDLSPLIERNKKMANVGALDNGIKEGWWHYCDIPPVVELKLKQMGINIHDQNDSKRMFEVINRDYPYLKVTHKHHAEKYVR